MKKYLFLFLFLILFISTCKQLTKSDVDIESLKEELVSLSADITEKTAGKIMNKYTFTYLPAGGTPLSEVEIKLLKTIPAKHIINTLYLLCRKRIFNSFTDKIYNKIKKELVDINGKTTKLVKQILLTYESIKLYEQKENKTIRDWKLIRGNLIKVKTIKPISIFNDALLDSFLALEDYNSYFHLKAYNYFDEEDFSIISELKLLYHYSKIKGNTRSFLEELELIKKLLFFDIKRTVKIDENIQFTGEYYKNAETETKELLDFNDKNSFLYKRRSLIIFFSLTCSYCIKDLQIISSIIKENPEYLKKGEILGIKMPVHSKLKMFDKLLDFKHKYNIGIKLFENDESNIFPDFNVTSVPRLYFTDESGKVIQVVKFNNHGHLKMKIKCFLDEYF